MFFLRAVKIRCPPTQKKKEKSKSLPGGIGVENDLQLLMYKAVSSKK